MQPTPDSLVARTYRPLLQTGLHKLIGFALRQQGLMVSPGNPLGLKSWSDLLRPDVRFVNRTLGTGTRLLLDDWLAAQSLAGSAIQGYEREESSHSAVAASVASGQADCALGIESAARALGLDFVPLLHEHYWLVCLKSTLETPAMQQLLEVLRAKDWAILLSQLPGYGCETLPRQVQSLKLTLPWW